MNDIAAAHAHVDEAHVDEVDVRDARLYRQTHGTFEDYCKERWGMHRSRAYRFIEAAETVEALSPMGDTVPNNERQARPLTKLEPEAQRQAWAKAVETAPEGRITAAHVERTVRSFAPPDGSQAEAGETEPPRPSRQVVMAKPYTARMKTFVAAAMEVTTATDDEIAGIPANQMMLQSLLAARDVLDRIIDHHSRGEISR